MNPQIALALWVAALLVALAIERQLSKIVRTLDEMHWRIKRLEKDDERK